MVADEADGEDQVVWVLLCIEVRSRHEHGM